MPLRSSCSLPTQALPRTCCERQPHPRRRRRRTRPRRRPSHRAGCHHRGCGRYAACMRLPTAAAAVRSSKQWPVCLISRGGACRPRACGVWGMVRLEMPRGSGSLRSSWRRATAAAFWNMRAGSHEPREREGAHRKKSIHGRYLGPYSPPTRTAYGQHVCARTPQAPQRTPDHRVPLPPGAAAAQQPTP